MSAPVAERPAAAPGAERGDAGGFVARAAGVTGVLLVAGSALGLLRDQTLAHLYGAGGASDAFLISWTLPEIASTLLIEEAMALVLVPAFSLALARRAASGRPDPVRALLAATFPRLVLVLAVAALAVAAGAPLLVRVLAPGLADPSLAVDCTRLTASTVLTFGVAGYFSALLRAHRSFLAPAAIYVAYNCGIIATALVLHARWGIRAAALGVAVGGLLMALVQLPFVLRRLPPGVVRRALARPLRATRRAARPTAFTGMAVAAPVACFALSRQAQVLVERFLAASLPAGAISHLNYAQKVAQLPMAVSLLVCTVTLPLVARAMADGDTARARRRVERDLALSSMLVLLGAAAVIGLAPQLIAVLFQRGAFDAEATAATAAVMRVYAVGLLGHTLVGTLIRPFFSAARPTWYPLAAMSVGLLLTVAVGTFAVRLWGAPGIAAANAAGITVTALLLLRGLSTRMIPLGLPRVLGTLARQLLAAAAATGAAWAAGLLVAHPLAAVALGGLLVPVVFVAVAHAARVPEAAELVAAGVRFAVRGPQRPGGRDRTAAPIPPPPSPKRPSTTDEAHDAH